MKHLFFAVVLLGLLCSCAHNPPEPPLYLSRFHTEKDAYLPNGWHFVEDEFYSMPASFRAEPCPSKYDEDANSFTVKTMNRPALFCYSGYFEINDDSVVDLAAEASGTGSFSLGMIFCDADREFLGERHQGYGFTAHDDVAFKDYRFRLYFLANENRKARYVRLMFIVDPNTTLTLRGISLDITPYTINQMDATFIKFKKTEAKEGYRKQN